MLDVFFKPEYVKLYENSTDKLDIFNFECEYGKIQHSYIVREIPWEIDGTRYYDITSAYGYGGPVIIESHNHKRLVEEYNKAFINYCSKKNIVSEFVRFHLYENIPLRENYYGEAIGLSDNVVVNTRANYQEIYANYEHKVRKNIKRAINNGLEILVENNLDNLDSFLSIYYQTMDRNKAKDFYYFEKEYFEAISNHLPDNFVYFYVISEGKIISAELVLYSETYAYSFLGGTDSNYYSLRPNDFLKDSIIKWCVDCGIVGFVLGGGYEREDGIYRYKKSFSSTPDQKFYIGKHVFNKNIYERLISKARENSQSFDESSSYFPLYRSV